MKRYVLFFIIPLLLYGFSLSSPVLAGESIIEPRSDKHRRYDNKNENDRNQLIYKQKELIDSGDILKPFQLKIPSDNRQFKGQQRPFSSVTLVNLEKNFRVNTTALLYLARETLPAMLEAGKGTILVTGNTSATRGKTNWGFFASTKASQRILAESIAREFGPKGIHVAYFVIDAMIDTPRTRPILAPDKPDEFFAKPSAIAEEMFRVAHQDPSTWSFLVELRPFREPW